MRTKLPRLQTRCFVHGKCSHLPYPRIYGIHDGMMLEEEVVQLRTENQELKQQLAQVAVY